MSPGGGTASPDTAAFIARRPAIARNYKTPTGRPTADIDWDKVGKMLQAGVDGASIADMHGIHPDTLYIACKKKHGMTFSAFAQKKRAVGCDTLRLKQFEVAMKGNPTMLIWLGKNVLGQKDSPLLDSSDFGRILDFIESQKVEDAPLPETA